MSNDFYTMPNGYRISMRAGVEPSPILDDFRPPIQMKEYSEIENECSGVIVQSLAHNWKHYTQNEFLAFVHGANMFSGYSRGVDDELHFLRMIRQLL